MSSALLCTLGVASAQTAAPGFVRLVEPLPGQEVIAKKPRVRVQIDVPFERESLYVTLDGADITALLEVADGGVSYTPVHVLPGGPHVLTVALRTRDRLDLSQEFHFVTRHTRGYTQFLGRARAGVEAERLGDRREETAPEPSYRAQGDIGIGIEAAEGPWNTRFESNLWFLNQKLPVTPPPREGLDLASYRLNTTHRGAQHVFTADVGDIQIAGSNYAFSGLARRGGQLGLSYKSVSLGAFAVNARQLFGFNGGTGIGLDADTNIYGVTAGIQLFDDRVRLQTIQARGGEPGSSFGLFTDNRDSRGRVSGYLLTANPSPALQLQLEYDRAEFDADTADATAARSDDAYGVRLSGSGGIFNYQLAYERVGPDYAVVASPVPSDQESIAASASLASAAHSVSATLLHQFDNVDAAPDRARLTNNEWAVDYGYGATEHWLLGGGYRRSRVESSREPLGAFAQHTATESVTGRAQYARHPWLVSAELARSEQDDELSNANDSVVHTRALSAAYQTPQFSVMPLIGVNTTTLPATGVELEQRNLSLTLNGAAWRERFGYGLVLAWNDQQSSDNTIDGEARSTELRLSYRLGNPRAEGAPVTISVRAMRSRVEDRVVRTRTEDWAVWLALSAGTALEY